MSMEKDYKKLIEGLEPVHEYEDSRGSIDYYKVEDYYVIRNRDTGFGYGDYYYEINQEEFDEIMARVAKAKKMVAAMKERAGYLHGHNLISKERERQYDKEGWKADRDAEYKGGELLKAASTYIAATQYSEDPNIHQYAIELWWPWDAAWYKPKDKITNLVKAGALIAAEIDRLKRLENEEVRKLEDSSTSKG